MLLPATEGFFASSNPRAATLAGFFAFRAAEPDGVEIGRFAWADVGTGLVSNERTDPQQILGFASPTLVGGWQLYRMARGQRFVRPGIGVTLFAAGDFWVRFPDGASAGQPVYASLVDGSPISGEALDAELTPWYVATDTAPGQLAIISTYSKVQQ